MLLDDLLSQRPATAFIYLQRRVNDRLPFRDDQTDVPSEFRPDGPADGFALPFALLPEAECDCFESRPDVGLRAFVRVGDQFRFPVHPLMVKQHHALKCCGTIWAVPLASVRTVFIESDGCAFMVKTDLPCRVVFTRRLRRGSITHSRDVMRALSDVTFPDFCAFLPETISLSVRSTDGTGAALDTGCVFRELGAWPRANQPSRLVPFYSLYSRPNREEPVLLCQLVERNHRAGEDEFDTFARIVLLPLLDSLVFLVTEHGLLPEAHAQNTFLEMDDLGRVTRLVLADLQDFCVDPDIRSSKGLPCDFSRNEVTHLHSRLEAPTEALELPARQIRYSSLFDFVLGRMLARCCVVLSRYPGCGWDRIRAAARERLTAGLGALGPEILPDRVAFRRYITEDETGKTLHIRPLVPPYR